MSIVVGITTQNRADVLPKAIRSALSQDVDDLSVVVFDDCSTDTTPLLKTDLSQVKWLRSDQVAGYLHARNKLMQETDAEFFCSLDDDAWFLGNDELAAARSYLLQNPEVAVIAFDILSPDFPEKRNRKQPLDTANFIGCGHVLRLSAVKEVGYYEPLPMNYGSEEKDLCLRLLDRGYRIVFMPGIHVWHDKVNFAADEKRKHQAVVCNDLVFFYRRAPWFILIPGLLLKLTNHLIFALTYKQGALWRALAKGFLRFVQALPSLQRQPVKLQTLRYFNHLNRNFKKK